MQNLIFLIKFYANEDPGTASVISIYNILISNVLFMIFIKCYKNHKYNIKFICMVLFSLDVPKFKKKT